MVNGVITIHLGDAFLLDIPATENEHLCIAIAKTWYLVYRRRK